MDNIQEFCTTSNGTVCDASYQEVRGKKALLAAIRAVPPEGGCIVLYHSGGMTKYLFPNEHYDESPRRSRKKVIAAINRLPKECFE